MDATRAELVKAAEARIAKSTSIASKGTTVDKPRAVMTTVSLDKPVTDAKGLTVHMGITGVEQNGKCPLFDLAQKFSMSGGKERRGRRARAAQERHRRAHPEARGERPYPQARRQLHLVQGPQEVGALRAFEGAC